MGKALACKASSLGFYFGLGGRGGGEIFLNINIAHSLSISSSHQPDRTKIILLKRTEIASDPSSKVIQSAYLLWKRCLISGPEVIKIFSWSTQLSMKFFRIINVNMPTIIGTLTLMIRKNSILCISELEKKLNF